MIIRTIRRFAASRRSAVAVIMALSLVPLMLLVGIAVDFTFLYQARTQTAFASQAAASQALRIATATYALEVANGATDTAASERAIYAGQIAGNLWFSADLGTLTRASLSSPGTTTITNTNPNGASVGAPVFQATVTDSATYPPIFAPLFGNANTKWTYASNATGTTSYAFAQILFMLDTSNSMLIGARQSDIQTMEQHSVCIKAGTVVPDPAPFYFDSQHLSYQAGNDFDYNFAPGDNTWIGFSTSDTLHVLNYNVNNTAAGTEPPPSTLPSSVGGSAPYQMRLSNGTQTGLCDSGYNGPFEPCALACHSQPNGGFVDANGITEPADLYGLARAEQVELRVDVLLSATENALQDMASSEAVQNQLSAGVYQFNVDVAPIARGNTNTGDALPEATSDLTTALKDVEAVDWNHNHGETSIPVLVSDCSSYTFPTQENCYGNTDLVQSMQHLVAGKLPTDTNAQPLTQAGDGSTAAKPLKFLFLVTDGMEGERTQDGAVDLNTNPAFTGKGIMTTLNDNAAVTNAALTPGTCTAIKKLGYTVYVLYVDYLPVSESQYYTQTGDVSAATTAAFPGVTHLVDIADSEPTLAKDEAAGYTNTQINTDIAANVPTAKALSFCASSPADFYSANSDTDIQTALAEMLKAALASTIRLTN